jgi:hypothetical protein
MLLKIYAANITLYRAAGLMSSLRAIWAQILNDVGESWSIRVLIGSLKPPHATLAG